MLLTYLMLFVALMLSAVAAFYSIVGLTAIFAAAVVPIVIMGTILEAAKLVVTVWLHEYWRQVKLTMKLYLVPAVFILMVITSMGIFGFLSKAHTDQALVSGDASAKLAIVDEKIRIERENIANARAVIQQMDAAVTGVLATGDQETKLKDGSTQVRSAAERSLQIRRSQSRDREALTRQIEEAQTRIVRLQEESAPLRAEFRKVEAEVGPIKYIAALIYGDNPDANLLEKAVRWVIIILVIVFDPLAIMMLLAFTESLKWERDRRAKRTQEENDNGISPASEPPAATIPPGPAEPEAHSGAHTDQPPDDNQTTAQQPDPGDNIPLRSDGSDADQPREDHRYQRIDAKFLDDFHEPDWPDAGQVGLWMDERPGDYVERSNAPKNEESVSDDDADDDDDRYKEAKRIWKERNPGQTLKEQRRLLAIGRIDHLPWEDIGTDEALLRSGDFGFGPELPATGAKGDRFVRTDSLPTRLYKHNGDGWIETDKTLTDSYAHDQRYIEYLIERIAAGEYDPELLTDGERAEIETRLRASV
jgi:hypothetical protein